MNRKLESLHGWGKYPVEVARVYDPADRIALSDIIQSKSEDAFIARGLGRSYGDTALNHQRGVILQNHLKHISFEPSTGILTCDGGVTYEDLLEHVVPMGFLPPVTPGTKYVTMGGAIANDIHGKNHHRDGSISEFVLEFSLLTSTGSILRCSRDKNPAVFWATIGGIGLTGIILELTMKLFPIETSYVQVQYEKARNLDDALDNFSRNDHRYPYSVAWIDCLASGDQLGRSILMYGDHASRDSLPQKIKKTLSVKKGMKITIPFDFPSFALNPYSIKLFNHLYYGSFQHQSNKFAHYDNFFYPLDSINGWNRAYGKKGFLQYQVALPFETSREGLVQLLTTLSDNRASSFLAVLKRFGEGSQGPLSFPFPGYTLALDIPIRDGVFAMVQKMDDLVVSLGGRVYLAKDSTLSPESIPTMYPKIEQFRNVKRQVDPLNLFSSSMSRRLRLMGEEE